MKVLLLGSGGREHALAWKIAQSPKIEKLYIAPGNAGTSAVGENVAIKATDFPALKAFALEHKIDMIVVGPEDPLVQGIFDFFKEDAATQHIAVIGPSAKGAQLEGSKEFAKEFMLRHHIPTARYKSVTAATLEEGLAFLETLTAPYVLKADGLCAGKGVLILPTLEEARKELKEMLSGMFGDASATVVHFIQEGLTYRFTPFDTDKLGVKIDSEKMYDNLMHKFKFGGIDKPGIYIDENAMRMCHSHRRIFSQLAQQLIREGKKDKAKAALDYAEKMIPAFNVPYDWQNGAVQMAEAYYQLGDSTKADDMMKALADKAVEYLTWYLSMDDNRFSISTREFEYHWAVLDAEVKIMRKYNSKLAEIYAPKVEELYNLYAERYERLQKMEKK